MLEESPYVKIRVTVPVEAVDQVRQALGDTGAGQIGNYSYCAFTYPVTGYFKPEGGADPAVGTVGKLETVQEVMIEAICHKDIIKQVIEAVVSVHPYEEPAIDIMPRYELQ
ncbi:MAG: hypothetical protein A3J66_03630 [Candidatus Magasanikbacteria bacterium RIFCSPHIGHO2_02_FULL_47_14]|uniref:Cytochrome C biogenesis protein n=1 Tax=Candidatus Magasanikbacteria bacterium RIFCSPHIGHO2_02_FULL_47_14 TaxID=1798680 RepID=A0A1F6M778_9BACT|nr:MAG: hypothetical protein A3J66_03630 [Candidatus Magasanikbacteria bacterium RIFCSPHIGHO2_02_FULL_47_14]